MAKTREVYRWAPSADVVGKEWSTVPLSGADNAPLHSEVTPSRRLFFGSFGSQSVNLDLRSLPAHKELAISFDLLIIGSWSGIDGNFGPSTWSLSVADGPTLLRTTFANTCEAQVEGSKPDDFRNLKLQAYPDNYPGGHNPMYSGADEVDTLGYQRTINGDEIPMDALYKIRYTFPHSDPNITLTLAAQGLEGLATESWGIANVRVSVDSVTVAAVAPTITAPHTTTIAAKFRPTATRSAALHKPVVATRRSASTKRKPSEHKPGTAKTTSAGRLHDKKKPLTP